MNNIIKKTMKMNKTATKLKPGMTLIEITVVILVLLTLIAVLFIGANIYKKGADRAACILNIRNIQQAVRADQNLYNKREGDAVFGNIMPAAAWSGTNTDTTLLYFEQDVECPEGTATVSGLYTVGGGAGLVYPDIGTVIAVCPIEATVHVPGDINGW